MKRGLDTPVNKLPGGQISIHRHAPPPRNWNGLVVETAFPLADRVKQCLLFRAPITDVPSQLQRRPREVQVAEQAQELLIVRRADLARR